MIRPLSTGANVFKLQFYLMQLQSEFKYLQCVVDVYSKEALMDTSGIDDVIYKLEALKYSVRKDIFLLCNIKRKKYI